MSGQEGWTEMKTGNYVLKGTYAAEYIMQRRLSRENGGWRIQSDTGSTSPETMVEDTSTLTGRNQVAQEQELEPRDDSKKMKTNDSEEEVYQHSSNVSDEVTVDTYLMGYRDGYKRGRDEEARYMGELYFSLSKEELENLMDFFGPQYISHERFELVHGIIKRARVWLEA